MNYDVSDKHYTQWVVSVLWKQNLIFMKAELNSQCSYNSVSTTVCLFCLWNNKFCFEILCLYNWFTIFSIEECLVIWHNYFPWIPIMRYQYINRPTWISCCIVEISFYSSKLWFNFEEIRWKCLKFALLVCICWLFDVARKYQQVHVPTNVFSHEWFFCLLFKFVFVHKAPEWDLT